MRKELAYSFLKTIIMLLILLNFGGVLSVFYPLQLVVGIFFVSIILFLLRGKFSIKKKYILFLFITYTIISFSISINKVSFFDYKGIFISLFSCVIIFSSFKNIEEIKKYFIKACKIIVWLAFLNFILYTLFSSLFIEAVNPESNYRVYTFFYIFNTLGVPYQIAGINFYRNQGAFWEPGILQIIANIIIYYYLFEENKSLKQLYIPIFVLLTTASTTGMFLFAFLFSVKYLRKIDIKKILILSIMGIAFVPILINDIEYKFKGDGKNSSQWRTYDTLMGLYVVYKNPLTGIGISEDKYFNEIRRSFIKIDGESVSVERGNTNSIILICLYFGIPLSIIILHRIYHQNLFKKKWLFFLILMICLASEPLIIRTFFSLLLVSSIKIEKEEKFKYFPKNENKCNYPLL